MTVFVGCPEGCRYHTASAVYDLVFSSFGTIPSCFYGSLVFPDKCEWTYYGAIYIGSVNVSATGLPCFSWKDKRGGIQYDDNQFADGSAELAKNFCRNPTPDLNREPWCFADPVNANIKNPCATCMGREDYAGEAKMLYTIETMIYLISMIIVNFLLMFT